MDLETLQRTYKENDIYGNPVRDLPLPRYPHDGHLPPSQPELRGGGTSPPRTRTYTAWSGHPATGGTDLWREGGRQMQRPL